MGWYEETPTLSLSLIERCEIAADQPILDVGAGASTLVDHLLTQGYQGLIATDVSANALQTLQTRLGAAQAAQVQWVVDDLTGGEKLARLGEVAVWHDRAVLHFLTEEAQRQAYRDLLLKLVPVNGFVVIATFAVGGAEMCSGLPIRQYNSALLAEFLGANFTLLESHDYTYHMPSGNPRLFVYTRFQRTA